MPLRFTVLASGSGGNACLVQSDSFGVLIDAGLGPRQLAGRMRDAGLSWSMVGAVVLTHTHSDHWKDRTLAFLHRTHRPFYCHPTHHYLLRTYSPAFTELLQAGLVRPFEPNHPLQLAPGLTCRPFPLRHDSGATFGFRIEGPPDLFGQCAAVAYAADLGSWDDVLAGHLADADLLALEFNHDVSLERGSGRAANLIARVLGDEGHLSNDQAANLVRAVLRRSQAGRLQHLVQLHLSRDCNRPALARQAGKSALDELAPGVRLHTAQQDAPGATLRLDVGGNGKVRSGGRRAASAGQRLLPGME
jgi:phosphoribosyl 1,2-cyclic phosphodiesterase